MTEREVFHPGMGRFRSDPAHDASRVPTVDQLMDWANERIATSGAPLNVAMGHVRNARSIGLTALQELLGRLPAVAARRRDAKEAAARIALRDALTAVHATMTEFGSDLRRHPTLELQMETLASYSLFAPGEALQRSWLDENRRHMAIAHEFESTLDQIDTERRIAEAHAGIRAFLELEAAAALANSEELMASPARYVEAMRAAAGIARHVQTRSTLIANVRRIEAGSM